MAQEESNVASLTWTHDWGTTNIGEALGQWQFSLPAGGEVAITGNTEGWTFQSGTGIAQRNPRSTGSFILPMGEGKGKHNWVIDSLPLHIYVCTHCKGKANKQLIDDDRVPGCPVACGDDVIKRLHEVF